MNDYVILAGCFVCIVLIVCVLFKGMFDSITRHI